MADGDDKKRGQKGRIGAGPPEPPHVRAMREKGGGVPPMPPIPGRETQAMTTTKGKESPGSADGKVVDPVQDEKSKRVVDQVLLAASRQETETGKRAVEKAILATQPGSKQGSSHWPFGHDIWKRIPTAWKVITVVAGIFVSGASGYAALQAYTDKYATKASLEQYKVEVSELKKELGGLRDSYLTQKSNLEAAKKEMDSMREDVRTLLKHMLANPPPRDRRSGK